jgi:hypothetical protein
VRAEGGTPGEKGVFYRMGAVNETVNQASMTTDQIVEKLEPSVARHRRPAWKPLVDDGDGPATASKFCGTAWVSDTVISQVKRNPDGFVWSYFRDADHLGEWRLATMKTFLADFANGKQQGRYVVASLPSLPFADSEFSLALVSHLLFLYSEQFDRARDHASNRMMRIRRRR